MNKTCTKCKIDKPSSEFYKATKEKDGLQDACKSCHSIETMSSRAKNRKHFRDYENNYRRTSRVFLATRLKKWGITLEDYDAMLISQNWCCYICKKSILRKKQCIDHDHNCSCGYTTVTKKGQCCGDCIRGILCNDCNIMLGMSHDNIEVLSSAINYVKSGGIWA